MEKLIKLSLFVTNFHLILTFIVNAFFSRYGVSIEKRAKPIKY